MIAYYNADQGIAYARAYAEYFSLPKEKRLFFYDLNGNDCTNFCSQCVWAAYGGWINGMDDDTIARNKERINSIFRMVKPVWYGSLYFSGSNKWCRVMELYDYALAAKNYGPRAWKIFEGDWSELVPSSIRKGDVIQMVVASYTPDRYGHCLYVTEEGQTLDEVRICCHSYDRLDARLSEFSIFPEEYRRLRIIRFKEAQFIR